MYACFALQASTKTTPVAILRAKIAPRGTTAKAMAMGSVMRALQGSTVQVLGRPQRSPAHWATIQRPLRVLALNVKLDDSAVLPVAQARAPNAPAANTRMPQAKRAALHAPL